MAKKRREGKWWLISFFAEKNEVGLIGTFVYPGNTLEDATQEVVAAHPKMKQAKSVAYSEMGVELAASFQAGPLTNADILRLARLQGIEAKS